MQFVGEAKWNLSGVQFDAIRLGSHPSKLQSFVWIFFKRGGHLSELVESNVEVFVQNYISVN